MSNAEKINAVKHAETDFPVHDLVKKRWSPYSFIERPVASDDLRSIFEAARWAPSSYNEQPWFYIVAAREDKEEFEKLLSCLVDANQEWAQHAAVLVLGIVRLNFSRNDQTNRHAWHDLGLASAYLTMEATARSLSVHQMAGIHPDKARELYNIPEGFEAVTGLAIGYAGYDESTSETFQERDETPRRRRPIKETFFGKTWGKTHRSL
jgi:nitroreductase